MSGSADKLIKRQEDGKMIIRNAVIHDAIHREPYQGDILMKDGKLVSVGAYADAESE